MIDRLIYVLTSLALLSVFIFEGAFAVNLTRAVGIVTLPTLDPWSAAAGAIFLVLLVIAMFKEMKR